MPFINSRLTLHTTFYFRYYLYGFVVAPNLIIGNSLDSSECECVRNLFDLGRAFVRILGMLRTRNM